ncbi:MAG: hypothetical protein E3J72_01000 [Planctomycetota bacterium]|nr:MAG: hypothetical protein E3J72_01000 [Planctomycetota bacterium]
MIDYLAKEGYSVDIYSIKTPFAVSPDFDANKVRYFEIRQNNDKKKLTKTNKEPAIPFSNKLKRWLIKIQDFISRNSEQMCLYRLWKKKPYSLFIVIEPEGILPMKDIAYRSSALYRILGIPFIYISLELLLSGEITEPREKLFKNIEKTYSRRARFVIIQDKERGDLFAQDNLIPIHKLQYLPNSPGGPLMKKRFNFWHEMLDIDKRKKILLHAGGLSEWTMLEDIIPASRKWPANWVLVIHTHFHANKMGEENKYRWEYLKDIAEGNSRVIFSEKPASRKLFDQLISSADAIIAFYKPVRSRRSGWSNIKVIGLSSGKVAYALRSGLPVIVNNETTLGEFVQKTGCGVCVETASETGSALRKIESNYGQYSEMAYKTFEEHLRFEKHFKKIMRKIEKYL